MRRSGFALALLAGILSTATAGDVPPLALAAARAEPLSAGVVVSKPLEAMAEPPAPPTATAVLLDEAACAECESLGRAWLLAEFTLGGLSDGGSFTPWAPLPETPPLVGGRFRLGTALGGSDSTGLEATYRFFDGPFALAATPWSFADGRLELQSGDLAGVFRVRGVLDRPLAFVAGYRTLLARQDFHLSPLFPGAERLPGVDFVGWRAESRFQGALLGVRNGWDAGRWQFQWQFQAALGAAETSTRRAGSGDVRRTRFAALPEAEVRLGCELWDGARAYVGLDVLGLGGLTSGAGWGDPFAPFRGDFTAGGLLLGLDVRY